MEQVALVQPATQSVKGDHSVSFNNAALPLGTNYYMIELITPGQTARLIKRFMVIH
jgi:hypothetical protein